MPFWQIEYFSLGIFEVNVWSFFIALALATGIFWSLTRLKKEKVLKNENIFLLWLVGLISIAFLGARFFNWLEANWPLPEFFNFQWGGLSFFGGFLGALVLAMLTFGLVFKKGRPTANIFNLLALPLGLSLFIGRWGCFLVQDHPGIPTSLPWGIIWPNGVVRHPVILYLLLSYLALFLTLFLLERKNILKEKLGAIFFLWLGASRLLLDFTRIRSEIFGEKMLWELSVSQWAALSVFLLGLFLIFKKTNKSKSGD